jgi:hypothetical protein
MNALLDPLLEQFGRLSGVMTILGVGESLHLGPDMHRRAETAQVPTCEAKMRKFPSIIPKVIGTHALDQFTVRHDRTEPRFTCE